MPDDVEDEEDDDDSEEDWPAFIIISVSLS